MSPLTLLDPIDYVGRLRQTRGEDLEELGWSLADVYLELGGGSPRSSVPNSAFAQFFNGQARRVLAAAGGRPRLDYWAGLPERGAAQRDTVVATLTQRHEIEVARATGWQPDPRTRSLILAHNQIDAELHAYFRGAAARRRPARRRRGTDPQRATGAVCVLGAPRSGTSLTTRILNILGVDLGAEGELMAPAEANNAAGFWEHDAIAALNEDLLATLGGAPRQRWRQPPALEQRWERDPRLERHREAARSLLEESFAGRPLWGWKDPRNCLTLPFWRDALAQTAGVERAARYVICVRHPLDVAASLQARDGMSVDESLGLWSRYMSEALAQTAGEARVCVSYESYFPRWEEQAERLSAFLGLPPPGPAQLEEIATHIDESLRHHRGGDRDHELPEDVLGLYRELSELARA
jgi:hypothetical protein